MIPELTKFEQKTTLIMATGVQFLDFGLTLDLRKELPGDFAEQEGKRSLVRLQFDERLEGCVHPAKPGVLVQPKMTVPVDQSIQLLEGLWLPVPFFRMAPPRRFADGPTNWVRARIVQLEPGDTPENSTHRLTLAVDTKILQDQVEAAYLAPTSNDVQAGAAFNLAFRSNEMAWFSETLWVAAWIQEVFEEKAREVLRLSEQDIEEEIQDLVHHAHYLNWLTLIGEHAQVPELKILSNTGKDIENPIEVDMVLDVGNSRTCGILIENHPQDESGGMKKRYELELRDISLPHSVYAEPFESRLEFAEANFGKSHFSVQSGRNDAFLWPTIARVGREATRLASRRRGTEGSTGLSSPKRYLWDQDPYEPGWRFNSAFGRNDVEPHATAAPFSNLINEMGEALYTFNIEDQMPVFFPRYSRSSLMMFMLAEILVQALAQMNSPSQRLKQSHANKPRHLRNIILTVPPSMPKPERKIFEKRMRQAVGLVWKALNWHPENKPMESGEDKNAAWPPLPNIHMQWDEATCGQVVYLYTEIINNFGGRPEEFFATIRRTRSDKPAKKLTIASIDIGGGTTDLVITDYTLDSGQGSNVYIVPEQRFRDGFKVAGDEIMLETIQAVVIPALARALKNHGVTDPETVLSRLIGSEAVNAHDAMHRQQLTLQILYPIGIRILKEYEMYDPVQLSEQKTYTLEQLLDDVEQPTAEIINYFSDGVRKDIGHADTGLNILNIPIELNLRKVHELFISNRLEICKTFQSLGEIVYLYDCDVLLLTGRPSRLPGVQAFFRMLSPLPPSLIVPLNGYRTGGWYPFHKQGKVNDPKTTAAVGAMLCLLGQGRLPNFFFRANAFRPYSTVKYLGLMDENNSIKAANVFYSGVDLDNLDYELPDTPFEMRGLMRLGFRQFIAERWGASPLYTLSFNDEKARSKLYDEAGVFKVRLQKTRGGGQSEDSGENFTIAGIESEKGAVRSNAVKLQLNTLTNVGIGDNSYWLDSGSVFR